MALDLPEIEKLDEIVSDAYHGTTLKAARQIVAGTFTLSLGDHQYLGDGVYFYEGQRHHALSWARKCFPRQPLAIIQATVNIGRCLDLEKEAHRQVLTHLSRHIAQFGIQEGDLTDAVLINCLAQIVSLDSIRLRHEKKRGGKIFPGSRIAQDVYLILCVRRLENILHTIISYREN